MDLSTNRTDDPLYPLNYYYSPGDHERADRVNPEAAAAITSEQDLLTAFRGAVPAKLWTTAAKGTVRAECARLAGLGWTVTAMTAAASAQHWSRLQHGGGLVAWLREQDAPLEASAPSPRRVACPTCGPFVELGGAPGRIEVGERGSPAPCPSCASGHTSVRLSTAGTEVRSA